MAEIVLQFSTQEDPLSWAIRTFDHGFWATHVDTLYPDGTLLGARFYGGVQRRPKDYTQFSRTEIVKMTTSQDVLDDYYTFLQQQIGKPYDSTAITGMVLGRDWREDDSWFCDELVFAGLERQFLPHPIPVHINRLTPADLMLVCSMFASS